MWYRTAPREDKRSQEEEEEVKSDSSESPKRESEENLMQLSEGEIVNPESE